METFTWRVSTRDGFADEATTFTVDAATGAALRDLWSQIERMPPCERRTLLIRELRTLMDLAACFPGGGLQAPESRSPGQPAIPSYLSRPAAEKPADGLLAGPEPEEDEQTALPVRRGAPEGRRRPRPALAVTA